VESVASTLVIGTSIKFDIATLLGLFAEDVADQTRVGHYARSEVGSFKRTPIFCKNDDCSSGSVDVPRSFL